MHMLQGNKKKLNYIRAIFRCVKKFNGPLSRGRNIRNKCTFFLLRSTIIFLRYNVHWEEEQNIVYNGVETSSCAYLDCYKWYQSQTLSSVPTRMLDHERGGL